jgi:2-aminoadipate transaminase
MLSYYPHSTAAQKSSPLIIQKMLQSAGGQNKLISFAAGLPDPKFFPTEDLAESFQRQSHKRENFQYALPCHSLKDHIIEIMAQKGVQCSHDEILLTCGAQQGISLLVKLMLNPSQSLVVEPFVYPGFKQIVDPYNPSYHPLSSSLNDEASFHELGELCSNNVHSPFLYTVPHGHNPLGYSLSLEQKQSLVAWAEHYQIPIIEDDPYGFLNYEGGDSSSMCSMSDQVISIGSFSKNVAPSLRVGWIVAPKNYIKILGYLKDQSDVNSCYFSQYVLSDYLAHFSLEDQILGLQSAYKRRRDVALNSVQKYFPANTKVTHPDHGFFLWVELESDMDMSELLPTMIQNYGVAYIPGNAFSIDGKVGKNCLRISFVSHEEKVLEKGLKKLGGALCELTNSGDHANVNYYLPIAHDF